MGQSQFIASSYRAYAVDGNADKKRDLWDSPADIIHSVANYFSKHHWKAGEPITQQTSVKGGSYQSVLTSNLKPEHSLKDLAGHHVGTPPDMSPNTSVKLLELQQVDSPEYWLAFHNFYVITRYNHSRLYAMAVFQLSDEIKNKLHQQ
jgi:membrane-bound lytic murein transglycosylase B